MKLKNISDIFFDLDHTLWDFDKNSALAFDKIFKINQVEVDLEAFLKHYNTINFEYWKLYRNEKIDKELLRFGRLNDTFLALNQKHEKTFINKLSKDYITYLTDNNFLYDHAIDVLEHLHRNYSLHIISNGFEEVQTKKLIKSNIHHYFKTIVNGETIGIKKPNPQIFHHALNEANTTNTKSVMVGDGFEADILGAMEVGMDVIYFNEFNKSVDGNIKTINNLLELKRYL